MVWDMMSIDDSALKPNSALADASKQPEASRPGALEAGLNLLEALSVGSGGVTELARRVDRDKANVFRLLKALQFRGYVVQDPLTKQYSLSAMVLSLAGAMLRSLDVAAVSRPIMAALLETIGESVHLAYPTAVGAVYIAQERPPNRVNVETEIGSRAEIHCTATGKALYAYADEARLRRVVALPLTRFTPRTIETFDGLLTELQRVRERGYAVDDEELNLGIRCVAAPAWNVHGEVAAAIGISGPAERISLARLDEVARAVVAAADELSARLGGRSPR